MNAERVARIRKDAGLTQAELADIVGVKQASVSRWERGVVPPEKQAATILRRIEERQKEAEEWEKTKSRLLRAVAAGGLYSVLHLLFSGPPEPAEPKSTKTP